MLAFLLFSEKHSFFCSCTVYKIRQVSKHGCYAKTCRGHLQGAPLPRPLSRSTFAEHTAILFLPSQLPPHLPSLSPRMQSIQWDNRRQCCTCQLRKGVHGYTHVSLLSAASLTAPGSSAACNSQASVSVELSSCLFTHLVTAHHSSAFPAGWPLLCQASSGRAGRHRVRLKKRRREGGLSRCRGN